MSAGRRISTWLAGRKTFTPMSTSKPPLILRVTSAGDDVAFLVLGDDVFPFLLPLGLAVGQDDGAALVLDGLEQHLDLVAGLGRHDLVEALVLPLAAAG